MFAKRLKINDVSNDRDEYLCILFFFSIIHLDHFVDLVPKQKIHIKSAFVKCLKTIKHENIRQFYIHCAVTWKICNCEYKHLVCYIAYTTVQIIHE